MDSIQFGWGEEFSTHPFITEMQQGLRDKVEVSDFWEAELEWARVSDEIG